MDTYAETFNAAVAAVLRAERAAQQVPVNTLAERAGLNRATLMRYLGGHRDIPVPALWAISHALELDAAVVLDRATARIEDTEEGAR